MSDFLSLSSEIADYDGFLTDDIFESEESSDALSLNYPEPLSFTDSSREPLSFTVDFPEPLFHPSSHSSVTNNQYSTLSNLYQDYQFISNLSDQLNDFNTSSLHFLNSFHDNTAISSFLSSSNIADYSSLFNNTSSNVFGETFQSLSSLSDTISNYNSVISSFANVRNSPIYSFFDSSSLSSFSSSLKTLQSFPQVTPLSSLSFSSDPLSYNITNDLPIFALPASSHSESAVSTQILYNAFQTSLSTPYQRLEDNQISLITIAKQIKDLLTKQTASAPGPFQIQISGD